MGIDSLFGRKEIIYGPMASGKSFELIRRCHRYKPFASQYGYEIMCFRPKLDTRRLSEADQALMQANKSVEGPRLESRSGLTFTDNVHMVDSAADIFYIATQSPGKKIISIEEGNLLDSELIEVVEKLKCQGNYVAVCILDKDYRGDFFMFSDFKKDMRDFIETFPVRDRIELTALCQICGISGGYTQRIHEESGHPAPYYEKLIKIGAANYQARCNTHHDVPGKRLVISAAMHIQQLQEPQSREDLLKTFKHNAAQDILNMLIEETVLVEENGLIRFHDGPRTVRLLGQ